MSFELRSLSLSLTILGLFVLDQWLKFLALSGTFFKFIDTLGLTLNFVFSYNQNIAFGLIMPVLLIYIFIFLILLVLLFLLFQAYLSKNIFYVLALTLILGGAFSNLVDRLQYQAVVDYIEIKIFKLAWPVFNVADMMIVVGILVWLGYDMRRIKDKN